MPSAPLLPESPNLLFTNAGMNQFVPFFLGDQMAPFNRATDTQKCIRAGGKHNDLEDVGFDTYHHTFFEMLGNFSFGDYFKADAIELAWKLVTHEFDLPREKLLVTVFAEDDQAFDLWQKIAGLPVEKIIRIPTHDNFWSMGETGPCGPCSEIFYDHGEHIPGGPPGSPDEDGDRFIEIWNLVFMQYEQIAPDNRVDLPKPSIDTGMGLERISAVLQGTHDNYETDLFKALIQASADATGVAPEGDHGVSHRVIADHLRASAFLIADGVLPSNEGRGYVLRRIMRRAMRHVHLMDCPDPVMFKLVPALLGQMSQAFPELLRAQVLITETLELEESRFKRTLDRGLKLLAEETETLVAGGELAGEVAFKLYDTFGFPLDLTQDALRREGYGVDLAGFESEMERQKADARAAWAGSGDAVTEQVWFELREQAGATEFLGYEAEETEGQVVALVVDGNSVQDAADGTNVAVITNQTPFYGESGGQQGDHGILKAGKVTVYVTDTQKKLGDLHVHLGTVAGGTLKLGDDLQMRVDPLRRASLRSHHSATHLLHAALRRKLGDHVAQKGSLVADDRLRFDISHPRPIDMTDLLEIEQAVNEQIRVNNDVTTRLMTPVEAVDAGALAFFGEKYGDEVRVVSMGMDGNQAYSTELCGGTHVRRTGDIGYFKVLAEGAVASGVRRIEAVTGPAAEQVLAAESAGLAETAALLKVSPANVPARVGALMDERRKLQKDLADARRELATGGGGGSSVPDVKVVEGIKFVGKALTDVPPKELKGVADDLKGQVGSGIVALISENEGKASLVVGVTADLADKLSAVDLVRAGSEAVGGKGGGGRPDMAQAGGPDGAKANAALAAIESAIAAIT